MKLGTHATDLILIIGGVLMTVIAASVAAYIYESRKSKKKPAAGKGPQINLTVRNLERIRRELKLDFNPNDPHDPLAAIIAAGEYFRAPGCEPGGPHYEETMRRVLDMVESMVPPDRVMFWQEQVHRLYGGRGTSRD